MENTNRVFISHDGEDEWAARQIAKELADVRVPTFLDAKDIKTGQSIQNTISRELRRCSHLLVLLTPKSVKSQWVSAEVGAAWAYSKTVVPIRLGITQDEVPDILRDVRTRDIGEIGEYYEEILATRVRPFATGDVVRIPDTPQGAVPRYGDLDAIHWVRDQDIFCGKRARITRVEGNGTDAFEIDLDDGRYWWPFEWFSDQAKPSAPNAR